jgi:cytosine/adenosine deaminase-related metal-dependent hydrolase
LIEQGTLIAMDPARTVAPRDVLVRDGRIVWLGPHGKAPRAARGVVRERLDARDACVLPGFVQAHVHLCQVLFRGLADDRPLLSWLKERIWPLEAHHDEASLSTSAELGVAELLRSGTTAILDMGTTHHHDAVFEVLEKRGLRAVSGKAMMDVGEGTPRKLRESTRASLQESDALRERWHGKARGRLRYAYAPRFILSCSPRLLRGVAERSAAHDVLMHTHVAEHKEERRVVAKLLGKSDLAALEECGVAGPRCVMAHGVQLTRAEMRHSAQLGTRFVHCPSANLKLASGIADVVAMRKSGLTVGIGCDGAPCNNRLDGVSELRLASLLAKGKRFDATALAPLEVLELATIAGARCLGWDDEIGSIEVGKRADVTVIALTGLHHAPQLDVLSSLVYASSAADVRHVLVDGVVRVQRGELLGIDVPRLTRKAREQALAVARRARVL